jgi:acetone carboxylase gamma subunit
MNKILENLQVAWEGGRKIFKCGKCGYTLGPACDGYRKYAMYNEIPREWGQEELPLPKTDLYVFRQFYCPECGVLFEVDFAVKGSEIIESVRLF